MNKAEKILLALQDHLNIKNYRELAKYFEVKTTTVYGWVRNNKIGNTGKILSKCKYINVDWLETGIGPMMIIDKENFHLLPNSPYAETNATVSPKIAARIEPGDKKIREELVKGKAIQGTTKDTPSETSSEKQPSMQDMLEMTKVVLDSNTVYRSALASNVRAFYKAVVNEGEMDIMRGELAAIRKENREMREGQERIEEMLRSLGAVDQKRDSAA